ncbi:uncharacterized protein B0I36DRAFT_367948 [Microdochium trichocladiopsis]|uniref:F-box domain-containing protein n=1 Tax=Microdochium trichocladiopsis TaxID=1682393 RepID=A0A9P8XWN1_9PEZI|nr:uncharacterized protein B0I36DRAFT_367948 [Microdochium trichocladiopsis]KAH7021558.1 hypothetical protein B0I36DRAFT_367948 [Microdochium trichocladiopsis]
MATEGLCSGSPFPLTRLPPELLVYVLENLNAKSLWYAERVCQALRHAAHSAFRGVYGPGVRHRVALSPSPLRELAIEEYKLDCNPFHYTWEITALLYAIYEHVHSPIDSGNQSFAVFSLLSLRRSDAAHSPVWLETVALALMIQGRLREADKYYAQLAAIGPPSEGMVIAQARYGSHKRFVEALQRLGAEPSSAMLDKLVIGAAARGDVDLLEYLCAKYVINLCCIVDRHSVASAAASGGQNTVLEFLQGRGVDITGHHLWPSPILAAVNHGHYETVSYLLAKGAPTKIDGEFLAVHAIWRGRLSVLRLLS